MHVTCNKRNTLLSRYFFFLEYEEEVLLHKLIIKLSLVFIVEIRLVNINSVSFNSISYVNVRVARVARGSMRS